jgi:hypothetical protein
MVGATDVAQVGNPAPFTDPRGNSPQKESVDPKVVEYAQGLMNRVVRGESLDDVVKTVIEGDFLPKGRNARRELVTA